MMASCNENDLLTIAVVSSYGGPKVVGAQIFYIDANQTNHFEFDNGQLLGATNEHGLFSVNLEKKYLKDNFSLLVKKEGYGNSLIQNYQLKERQELLEVILIKSNSISGHESKTLFFNSVSLFSEEDNSNEVELLSSNKIHTIDDLSVVRVCARGAYPIVENKETSVPIMMGIYKRPSGLGLIAPQNAQYGFEKSEDGYFSSSATFSFLYMVKEIKNGMLYFVAYDIMGNRVELPVMVHFESLDVAKGLPKQPKISLVEMRTFGRDRNLKEITHEDSRDVTGYAILYIDGMQDSKNFAPWSSLEIYFCETSQRHYEKILSYPIFNHASKYEVVVSSLLLQPMNSYKFKVRAFQGRHASAFSYSNDVSMLPSHKLKLVSPSPAVAQKKDDVILSFEVVGIDRIKAIKECSYFFTLHVESIDNTMTLGVRRKNKGILVFEPVTIILSLEKNQTAFFTNNSDGDGLIELHSVSYDNEKIHINLPSLISELSASFSMKPISGTTTFELVAGKTYQWAIDYENHGAMAKIIFATQLGNIVSQGLSFSSSNESDGLSENGSSYFSLKE